MADLVFVAALCAFFALCVIYVQWCDRIIGPDNFKPDTSAESIDVAGATNSTTVGSTDSTEVTV